MFLSDLNARDFSNFEPSENIREIVLFLTEDTSVEQILPALKKWRQLPHLTLYSWKKPPTPRLDALCDFIMGMKHLTYLHIGPSFTGHNRDEVELLQEKVTKFSRASAACCMLSRGLAVQSQDGR